MCWLLQLASELALQRSQAGAVVENCSSESMNAVHKAEARSHRASSNLQFLDFLRASMLLPLLSLPPAKARRSSCGIIGRYYAAPGADMRGTRESLEAALEAAGIEVIDRATFFSELKVAGDPDIVAIPSTSAASRATSTW